ncbi:hypothetical protein HRR83_005690 [Exophiala dermatitidis]|uniref:Adenosinetriphosphatase n=2 Tax=Exophiala dermatitidis TaxID=5970 RepID=H6BVJ7_EXODN|nr:uncharacterized protein HMPREF1120_03212 [Exophiala dermatitidis NIH/UT8656]KAJ4508040.1 hypothetical protein HRR73_007478 [Exophiala dermatitidis]EHY55056.1 hypothetical protein HMPREF1120_03212 [Exophiala dermatitidis NIH/UT8656]KAJ4510853.1 hypothetical protein HRR75_005547 [Exophiala dermatitidis]KAJ4513246.1 hypothetical protein HRR74_006058 [Exophiala dermatitidis]KAJ4532029.1 hypothetical protein HRR77_008989 [Exophiala dermatitidis]
MAQPDIPGFDANSVYIDLTSEDDGDTAPETHLSAPVSVHIKQEEAEPSLFSPLPEADPSDDLGISLENINALRQYNENKGNFSTPHGDVSANVAWPTDQDFERQLWEAAHDLDPAAENELAVANFARLREEYEQKKSLGTATRVDDVQFAADEAAEQSRLRDFARGQLVLEASSPYQTTLPPGYVEEDSLFIPEGPGTPPEDEVPAGRSVPRAKNRINKQELSEAMSVGIEAGYSKSGKPKRKAATTSDGPRPKKPRTPKTSAARKPAQRRKRTGPMLTNLSSLGRSNVVSDAQANVFKPDMPTFTARDKNKALSQLIASIPSADRASSGGDRKAIIAATKKFNGIGAVRADGQGGWRHKDMESSLYHHQLLGVAFMRDREKSDTKPKGGMLCDEMGFGKTIQMIANILDGKPDANSPCKTTLIVCPPSLLPQWMLEMDKHVKGARLGRIIRYHSGARLLSNDVVADLSAYDIILTSYAEVQKSYPIAEAPKHLSSEARKNEWWDKFYNENVGPLHRIKFHRIVLDEAHQIKNHLSRTSRAIRALTGVYRWCITGTPVLNYIEELFPYFHFLRVPHTGDYATFCNNFCNNRTGREPINMGRIHNILRAIMLRRTHVDTLFNAPIVKLPGITHTTHLVEFNEVERAIYKMVKSRYIAQINKYSRAGELSPNYRSIFGMMLRLRMLCSHILLCQGVLKQMFDASDIETLWRLTAREVQASSDETQINTIEALRRMLQKKDNTLVTSQTQATGAEETVTAIPESSQDADNSENTTGNFALSFKFRKFLRSLSESKTWTELHLRSTCGKCLLPPDDPICTSCLHVYCKECINAMEYERQERGEEKCACLTCGVNFEETSPCLGLQELGFNGEEVSKKVEKAKRKRARRSSSSLGPSQSESGTRRNSIRGITDSDDESDEEEKDPDWIELMGSTVLPSAKLTATKAAILNWQQTSKGEKIVIYTQFLGLCRILDKICNAEGWGHVLFHGKMTLEAREKAIEKFDHDPNVNIMICSLKAGGVGLNLTMASKVIILDLWFNSSIEAQAYCRTFRIGQTRPVEVLRFVVKDSIDEDLIKMQDRKDIEVTAAIGPENLGKRATIQQLLELFGEIREEGQNEFILVEDQDQDGEDDPNTPMAGRLPPRPF